MIFLKILYGLLLLWNLLRMIAYMIFATFDENVEVENIETQVNLLWAVLHAVIICALFMAWRIIF